MAEPAAPPPPSLASPSAGLASLIENVCGLTFHETRMQLLESRAGELLADRGLPSLDSLRDCLAAEPPSSRLWSDLLSRIVTRESFWFRQPEHFELLRDVVFPAVTSRHSFRGGDRVRILSAGCACGQEPYSLAILASEVAGHFPGVEFSIDACDIDEEALRHARRAEYAEPELRGLDPARRGRHFTQDGGVARLATELRSRVRFFRQNLLQPILGERYDVVLCRNVTIYFEPATTEVVLGNLAACLDDDGYIFAGHAESLSRLRTTLRAVRMGQCFVHRKTRSGAEGARPPA